MKNEGEILTKREEFKEKLKRFHKLFEESIEELEAVKHKIMKKMLI